MLRPSFFIRFISAMMALTMAWNVFGWLGFQVAYHQLHHQEDTHYCTKSFCYCEVNGEHQECTCHHQDDDMAMGHHNEHSPTHNETKFCHYENPHTAPVTTNISFITHDFQALLMLSDESIPAYSSIDHKSLHHVLHPQDVHLELLRPPIG